MQNYCERILTKVFFENLHIMIYNLLIYARVESNDIVYLFNLKLLN